MALTQSKDENTNIFSEVTDDFININKLYWKRPNTKKKRGGPYSSIEREKRRDEVFILYFDYGYDATKISKILNVNRNTISSDITYLSSKISKPVVYNYPEVFLDRFFERVEMQRTRSREMLDKTTDLKEKMIMERFITSLDLQTVNIGLRAANFMKRAYDMATFYLNEHMKSTNQSTRFIRKDEWIKISEKSRQKIDKIIEEDSKTLHSN